MSLSRSFDSALGATITSYLALKKALGRRFAAETDRARTARPLPRCAAPRAAGLTADSFAAWSLTLAHLTPTVRRNRMRIVRNLCLYLRRTDRDCFVPDPSGFPAPHTPLPAPRLHRGAVLRLLRATANLRPRSTSPLCAEVFRLAIVLLYTAGLRRGELVRLLLSDYDRDERTLLVRASKFHKSRLVALSHDAARASGALTC